MASLFTKKSEEGKEGLWSVSLAGGEGKQVIDCLIASRASTVAVDGIYFITGIGLYTIEFFSFRTHQHRQLAKVEDDFIYLTVSPDNRSLLWTQDDHSGSDLMLVESFR